MSYKGQKTVFVVQMFGTPRRTAPIATLTTESTNTTESETGVVSGEVIQEITKDDVELFDTPIDVIHQDETFIAVRGDAEPAPSTGVFEIQSTPWERMVASPQTTLSYVYTIIAGVVSLALVSLIFFEIHEQKPKNILYGVLVLLVISVLLYLSYTEVVVASSGPLSGLFESAS